MSRRGWILLVVTLLLAGSGTWVVAAQQDAPRVGRAAPTATSDPRFPTATPAPPLPAAFPALAAGQPYVYVVDYYRSIRVVDPRAAAIVGELPVGWGALPVFSPDGARLYVTHYGELHAGGRARLEVFAVATGRRLARLDELEVMAYKIWGPPIIAPSRDGRTVYVYGRRIVSKPGERGRDVCWIYVVEVGTRLGPGVIPRPNCGGSSLLLSADGRTLYSGAWLIDLTTRPPTLRETRDLAGRALAQSADGRWLYALDKDGTLAVWDADARQAVRTLPRALPAYGSSNFLVVETMLVSRDGRRLFIAIDDRDRHEAPFDGLVTLDSATGRQLGVLRPEHPFQGFTVSADGREAYLIARAGHEPDTVEVTLDIWDLAAGVRRGRVGGIGHDAGPVLAPPPPALG